MDNKTMLRYATISAVVSSIGTLFVCSGDGGTFMAAFGASLLLLPMFILGYYFSFRFIHTGEL
jgi:hypothetical protein